MTLMQMKYAIAVADTKSMNEAARSLLSHSQVFLHLLKSWKMRSA